MREQAGSGLRRSPSLLYVLAILVVATALIAAVELLHDAVVEHKEVQVLLGDLESDAAELHGAQLQAISAGEISPELNGLIQNERRDLRTVLDELAEMDMRAGDYARIQEQHREAETAEMEVIRLVDAGQVEKARSTSIERTALVYEEFDNFMDESNNNYGRVAERAETVNEFGTLAAGILGASALIFVFLRRESARKRSRRTLEESEQQHRSLFEQNPDGVYSLDSRGKLLASNPALSHILGYSEREFVGRSAARFIATEHRRMSAEGFSRALGGVPQNYETTLIHKDGHRVEIAMTQVPIVVDGEVTGVYGIAKDITQRRAAEEELRRAEIRYRTLVEQIPAVIYIDDVDETNSAIYRSPYIEEMLGYKPDEFVNAPEFWQDLLHPEDRERVLAVNEETNQTGKPFRIEYRMFRKDGRSIWVRDEAVLVRDGDGQPLCWQGVFMDTTERKMAEARLEEAETRYRSLVEQVPVAIYRQDLDHGGVITYISPQIETMTGYTAEQYLAVPDFWMSTVHPDDRERVHTEDERTDRTGDPYLVEFRRFTRDGRLIWMRDEAVLVRSASGEPLYWHGVIMDITERKEAEERLLEAEMRYRTLVEQVPAVTYIQEIEHSDTAVYVSPQIEDITGYAPEDFMADTELWYAVVHPDDRVWVSSEDDRTDETQEIFRAEYRMVHRNGSVAWVRDEAVLIEDASGEPRLWQGIMTDITERKDLEGRLRHQALHDPLTGLPNRSLFEDRLAHALTRSHRRSEKVAVLFVDLDNFKYVNDSLGHEMGDNLLVAVAARIKSCLRPGDTLARLGGDEFTILIEDVEDARAATAVVARVEEGLKDPFRIGRREVFVTASTGISLGDTASRTRPVDLMREADLAMYGAKSDGKNSHKVFEEAMNTSVTRRLDMESDLRRAVERGEFEVYYQPKVSLDSGWILGFEALVRWHHPSRGLILPSEFILLAEETGLVVPIGMWVLEEACKRARAWRDLPRNGNNPPSISVNISPRQFLQTNLTNEVSRVLASSGLEPEALELEVTETVLAEDALHASDVLSGLRDLGLRISIDDFGTGYSSLSRLRDLPVDALKIDRSFVAGLGDSQNNEVLISGMIELAAGLGLEVSAEGVETAQQAELLRSLGCEAAQGFFFSKPADGETASGLLLPSPGTPNKVRSL